jgi:hypothetical protein
VSTARLTDHARLRCAQMGIGTKRAKRVVAHRLQTYTDPVRNGLLVTSDDPDIAVVWDPRTNLILTVLWRTQDVYERPA